MRREALQRVLLIRLYQPRPHLLLNAIHPRGSDHVPVAAQLHVLNLAGTAEVSRIGLASRLGEKGERHVPVALPVEAVQVVDVIQGNEAVALLAVDMDQVQMFHGQLIRVRRELAVSLRDSGFEPSLSAVDRECAVPDIAEQEELPPRERQGLGRDLLAESRDAPHSREIADLCCVQRERGAERLGVESPLLVDVARATAAGTLQREEVDKAAEARVAVAAVPVAESIIDRLGRVQVQDEGSTQDIQDHAHVGAEIVPEIPLLEVAPDQAAALHQTPEVTEAKIPKDLLPNSARQSSDA